MEVAPRYKLLVQCSLFTLFTLYRQKRLNGKKAKEIFFTVPPYFKVTAQMGLLKSSQNETFGFTLKQFSFGFCHTLIS